jgi:hypothetical protein
MAGGGKPRLGQAIQAHTITRQVKTIKTHICDHPDCRRQPSYIVSQKVSDRNNLKTMRVK